MNMIKIVNIFLLHTLEILSVGTSCWWDRWMWYYNTPSLPSNDCSTLLCSLRAQGKDFSLNASFTACCSCSTKSIHILNREQREKHERGKEWQSVHPAVVRSPECVFHLSQPHGQRLWLQAKRKGLCPHIYLPWSGFPRQWGSGSGVKWEIANKYNLEGS